MSEALTIELGITRERILKIRSARSLEEARRLLKEMQTDVKSMYRQLIFKYHPDRNPGDPEAGTRVRLLKELLDEVMQLQVHAPAPPPRPVVWQAFVRPMHGPGFPGYGSTVTSTNAGTGTTTTYDARRVVFIKVD